MEVADSTLVVTTPERVAFEYPMAGIGSRFLAQCIDIPIVFLLLVASILVGVGIGRLFNDGNLANLIIVILVFVILFGYFWALEAAWAGQTVGKFVFGLRAIDQFGGPLTFTQAAVRNLVRLIDLIPGAYGIGLVTLFIGGSGRRLGDYAAGTLVVRERGGGVRLSQLPATAAHHVELNPADSSALRLLDADLRRFVLAYTERAPKLPANRRHHLAVQLGDRLSRVMPELATQYGPLAVLDRLAWLVTVTEG